MDPSKNPAEDKEEFKERLKDSLCCLNGKNPKALLKALIMEDQDELTRLRAEEAAMKLKREKYLLDWDNAANLKEREKIVGSVKP